MASSNDNPFVMPGMGQSNPDIAGNPLLASMEMMRQAWAGLTGPGGLTSALPITPPLNLEELDRRIAELKSVESWLSMNLSMLSSTIQGMEVQRSTINTLRSFVDAVSQTPMDAYAGQSPLEAVLGIRRPAHAPASGTNSSRAPSPGTASSGASSAATGAQADAGRPAPAASGFSFGTPDDVVREANTASAPHATAGAKGDAAGNTRPGQAPSDSANSTSDGAADAGAGLFPGAQAAQSASQAWFDMLQQQFKTMAQATAAATSQREPEKAAAPQSGRAQGAAAPSTPAARPSAAKAGTRNRKPAPGSAAGNAAAKPKSRPAAKSRASAPGPSARKSPASALGKGASTTPAAATPKAPVRTASTQAGARPVAKVPSPSRPRATAASKAAARPGNATRKTTKTQPG